MKPHSPPPAACLPRVLCLLHIAFGELLSGAAPATETTSAPVGEYHVPAPAGTSAWVYGLVREAVWEGTAVAVGAGSELLPGEAVAEITLSSPGLDPGVLGEGAHYAEVLDGAWAGLVINLLGGTADRLLAPAEFAVLEPGTRLAVRAHATLGTMFPGEESGIESYADLLIAVTPDAGGAMAEQCYLHDGVNWRNASTWEVADDAVIFPGQGFLLSLNGPETGAPRDIIFGTGPVCHVKETPTLVPLSVDWNAIQLMGPVWPVETEETGAMRTVSVLDLGLQHPTLGLAPYEDVACLFSWDGNLENAGIYAADGETLMDLVTGELGPALTGRRFVKGAALYLMACNEHYWLAPGVP